MALGVGAALLGPPPAHAQTPAGDVPMVSVVYGGVFDRWCTQLARQPLDTAMAASVRGRLPEYNARWGARGPALLAAARDLTGRPFEFRESQAVIFTCRGLPSMGAPLLLNARSFWRASPDSAAAEQARFVNVLFHELLRRYTGPLLYPPASFTPRPTPLLTKYAAEPAPVRGYLHLFALMQLAYERLGLAPEWALAKAMHRGFLEPGPPLRAHEIIAAEGADAFVRELRAAAPADTAR